MTSAFDFWSSPCLTATFAIKDGLEIIMDIFANFQKHTHSWISLNAMVPKWWRPASCKYQRYAWTRRWTKLSWKLANLDETIMYTNKPGTEHHSANLGGTSTWNQSWCRPLNRDQDYVVFNIILFRLERKFSLLWIHKSVKTLRVRRMCTTPANLFYGFRSVFLQSYWIEIRDNKLVNY